jgi:hypothetical protein
MYISPENQAKVNRVTARILRQALALNVHRELELQPVTQALVEQAIKEEANRLDAEALKAEVLAAMGFGSI